MKTVHAGWPRAFNLVLTFLVAVLVSPVQGAELRPSRDVAALGRGINILGYDGIWEGAANAPFRLDNLTAIRNAGFSHVRINFFGFKFMNAENVLDEAVLKRLDAIIEAALVRRLTPILDEHDTDLCQRDVPGCMEKLRSFWRQVASRYAGKYPALVFEILNEPGGHMTSAEWNSLLSECLGIIRNTNPERPVIVAALNTEVASIDDLTLPTDDRRLIVTFHYYAPIRFTHQGAPWSSTFSKIGPLDWGTPEDEAKVIADFSRIRLWSEREKRPVYLGEFGVYERAPADSRLRYLSFVTRCADKFGWAWAYWQFDHDFAAFDSARQTWKRDVLQAIVPLH
ncbi:cellulase [Bradyrhizobium sp. LTSPM299]|uniref:glycoside hydrolase family 5 protein n=1 Tax=Bradyrhizobium sp. LTSPM299 TaxID=1619233 RepID=UPI0005CA0B77|nr:glycoside hydrolase family 5 protein [Bradyrhizobium sp. LTSPM299]KJC57091.1 cellulase [Bradyrhizobium sp. LTSPM299]